MSEPVSNTEPIVNVSGYRFVALDELPQRRTKLLEKAESLDLKGTVLLSEEGINVFVAGTQNAIDQFVDFIRNEGCIPDFEIKESFSSKKPFSEMLVKIKREIIAFGVDSIDPRNYTSKRIPPKQLKEWLDSGKDIVLLDTRNDYEIAAGTFDHAVEFGVHTFRDFPQAVEKMGEDLKRKTIISFCTGGIRCEKAAPYLEQIGCQDVYQLDGGILKYFEECGGAHYHGDCFVFDERVAVDPMLAPTTDQYCPACFWPKPAADSEELVRPVTIQSKTGSIQFERPVAQRCLKCEATHTKVMQQTLTEEEEVLSSYLKVLPGSIPYENRRPLNVPRASAGMNVIDFLDSLKTHLSRQEWLHACREGRLLRGKEPINENLTLRDGDQLIHLLPDTVDPHVAADIHFIYRDEQILIVNKPAPLPIHASGRFFKNTLVNFLARLFEPKVPKPVHRLDAATTGVQLFAWNAESARKLQAQFEERSTEKVYLARVHGIPNQDRFESNARISSDLVDRVRVLKEDGLDATTEFEVLRRFADGTTLLKVRPLTGRTNQIRLHLQALGFPIVGDDWYGKQNEEPSEAKEVAFEGGLCLHAYRLRIVHPATNEWMEVEANPPKWAEV